MILRRLIQPSLLIFFSFFHLFSIQAESRSSTKTVKELNQSLQTTILEKESFTVLSLESLLDAYETKCRKGKHDWEPEKWDHCYLKLSDFFPAIESSEDRALLFRGEQAIYPTAGVSKSLRQKALCNEDCDFKKYMQTMNTHLEKLKIPKLDYLSKTYVYQNGNWLNPKPGYFSERDLFAAHRFDKANISEQPEQDNYSITQIISTDHADRRITYYVNESGKLVSYYDPFVSLTLSPNVAHKFANHKKDGDEARLIVVAVPEKNIVWDFPCHQNVLKEVSRTKLYDVRNCVNGIDSYEDEVEINAMLAIPPEYVFQVFRLR